MDESIQVAKAEEKDLARLLEIQYLAYPAEAQLYPSATLQPLCETLEALQQAFAEAVIFKAVKGEAIVGAVRCTLDTDICRIGRLCVDPAYQRQGIASALLQACETAFTQARSLELFTGARSVSNIRLYERNGYARCGEEYSGDGLTFVYLRKRIPRSPTENRTEAETTVG